MAKNKIRARFLKRLLQDTARRIYGDIDKLELHVSCPTRFPRMLDRRIGWYASRGHQASCPWCRTLPRLYGLEAILAGMYIFEAGNRYEVIYLDAIALTRGDRFFTTDFTPYNLTSWGFAVRGGSVYATKLLNSD